MRFGDPQVMALFGALCITVTVLGFTNRSLRAQVNHLLGTDYSTNQMSYDLARLRRNGLIERQPRSNIYILTADGQRATLFYTTVHNRLLRPLLAAEHAHAARAGIARKPSRMRRAVCGSVAGRRLRVGTRRPTGPKVWSKSDRESAAANRIYGGRHRLAATDQEEAVCVNSPDHTQ